VLLLIEFGINTLFTQESLDWMQPIACSLFWPRLAEPLAEFRSILAVMNSHGHTCWRAKPQGHPCGKIRSLECRVRVLAVLLGTGLCMLAQPLLAQVTWGGSLAVTSDYRLHSVTQSAGHAAVQGELHVGSSRWQAGLWASNVQFSKSRPRTVELDVFIARNWTLDQDWSTSVSITHYAYPWSSLASFYAYDELMGSVAFRDRAALHVAYSPNTSIASTYGISEHRRIIYADLSVRQPLRRGLAIDGGLGYYDASDAIDQRYPYWSLGLAFDRAAWHVDLTYYGTGSNGRQVYFDDAAAGRWAGTVMWRF
jgi:uncharacterized protein (TIGR02001 family)